MHNRVKEITCFEICDYPNHLKNIKTLLSKKVSRLAMIKTAVRLNWTHKNVRSYKASTSSLIYIPLSSEYWSSSYIIPPWRSNSFCFILKMSNELNI